MIALMRTMRRLQGVTATIVVGLLAGVLVSTVGSNVAVTQESTPQFTTQLNQVADDTGAVVLRLVVNPGAGAPSALEIDIDYNDADLTHRGCDGLDLLVSCVDDDAGNLTLAATTASGWASRSVVAELRFDARPNVENSPVTHSVMNALTADAAPIHGVAQPATVAVTGGVSNLDGMAFMPVTPCSAFDSRDQGAPLVGGRTATVDVVGSGCGVPANAIGAMINVVAINPTQSGNLRISAAGTTAQGGVVNFGPGATNSNAVPVELSTGGAVDVFVNSAANPATHLRLVVLGYYANPVAEPDAMGFMAVTPCSPFDSRENGGALRGQTTETAQITGNCGIPANATGAMINVVAVNPTRSGNLRISAAGTTAQGGVVNFTAGATNSNAVPVELSNGGAVDVFINSATNPATHVRLVVLGYYVDPVGEPDAMGFTAITPCSPYDSRDDGGQLRGGSTAGAQITGNCGIPANATGAMINVVAVNPTRSGNLRISAAGTTAQGGVVNFTAGATNSNAVPVELSNGGAVDVFINSATNPATHVRLVVLGYYT